MKSHNGVKAKVQGRSPLPSKSKRYLLECGTARRKIPQDVAGELLAADLVTRHPNGTFALSAAGLAWAARRNAELRAEHIDPFIAQHLDITAREVDAPEGRRAVVMDDSESPLVWLARRKGRDGRPLIAPHQLEAGERLRVEFTHAHMMPRVTSNWDAAVSQGGRDGGRLQAADTMVAARQRAAGACRGRAGVLRVAA